MSSSLWTDTNLLDLKFSRIGARLKVTDRPARRRVVAASGGPERKGLADYQGELYALYLLHAHRGQRTGTRLFESVVARFRQAGVRNLVVWVLEDNPHRRFYFKMGGQPCAQGRHAIDGTDYAIVAYGWKDFEASSE